MYPHKQLLAQSPILDAYIQTGLQSNLTLKQENLSIEKSIVALEEAKGLFRPQVSFQATYTLAGGGRAIEIPVGDLVNPIYTALNQLTGSNQFPTNIPNQTQNFLPNDFHETYLQVVQPLFNSDIYYNYKAKKELISVQQAQKKVYEQELTKNIKQAYFQYLQTLQVLKIYDKTNGLLQEVLRTNQKLVKNDKATSEVIYGAEYEISKLQNEVAETDKNRLSAQAYFNFLLNRPLESEITADTTLAAVLSDSLTLVNLEAQALQNRAEFTQLKTAMNANLYAVELNKNGNLPKVNVAGQAGYQGFSYKFDNTQDYWLVRFQLQWDIYKGKQNKQKIQQAQIEQNQLETRYEEVEAQIKLQVQRAYYELQASRKAIEASQAGLRSAEKNYQLTKKKYEQGVARYVELTDTQTKYTNAQIQLAIVQYNFLIKKAELERATGN